MTAKEKRIEELKAQLSKCDDGIQSLRQKRVQIKEQLQKIDEEAYKINMARIDITARLDELTTLE